MTSIFSKVLPAQAVRHPGSVDALVVILRLGLWNWNCVDYGK
jgi:hypothetical protein